MADQKLSNRVKFNISTDLWWTGRETGLEAGLEEMRRFG